MKPKNKLSKKAKKLIAVIGIFAILIGIAAPLTASLANKINDPENMTNAIEHNFVFPVAFGGFAVSEDVSGLAFKFDLMEVKGLTTKNGVEADYKNATIELGEKTYKLLGMGAVVHNRASCRAYQLSECNGSSVLNVPAKYLFDLDKENNKASFVVRVTNIPKDKYNCRITANPYVTVEVDGAPYTLYGGGRVCAVNEIAEPEAWKCESSCYGWVGTKNSFGIWKISSNKTIGEYMYYPSHSNSDTGTSSNTSGSSGGVNFIAGVGNSSGGSIGIGSGSSSSSSNTTSDFYIEKDWVTVKYVGSKLTAFVKCQHDKNKVHEFVIPEK